MTEAKRPTLGDRIGQFVALPVLFVNDTRVSADSFRLFAILRSYTSMSNATDKAFPGYETLRARCGFGSYRRVAAAVKQLEELGWMDRRKRFGNSTEYYLNPRPTVLPPLVELDTAHSPTTVGRTVLPPLVETVLPPLVEKPEPENQNQRYPAVERPRRKTAGFASVLTTHPDARVSSFLEILARPHVTNTDAALILGKVSRDECATWRDVLEIWAANPNWRIDLAAMFDRYQRTVNAKKYKAPAATNGNGKHAMPDIVDGAREILRQRAAARGETI